MQGFTVDVETADSSLASAFQSPKVKRAPTQKLSIMSEPLVGASSRHNPGQDIVEPKVYSPHKRRQGYVPRRIEVERKKRSFAILDLNTELVRMGVIDHLMNSRKSQKTDSVLSMSLSLFDNSDYESRSLEFWDELIAQSFGVGLSARAMHISRDEFQNITWQHCRVTKGNAITNRFEVEFESEPAIETKASEVPPSPSKSTLERIFICFDAESPVDYGNRLADAVRRQNSAASSVILNLYVDCMPVDNLKPLDSEQVNRILSNAINVEVLRQNSLLDTSSLLQQYNLNHMRTLNQLILLNMLRKEFKEVQAVNAFSTDASVFQDVATIFSPRCDIEVQSEMPFEDRMKAFKFSSLWNKLEAISIMMQVQSEDYALEKASFFFTPEKTMRIEEFMMNQQGSLNTLLQTIREGWANAITTSVRQNLKDVKKVWMLAIRYSANLCIKVFFHSKN